MGKQVNRSFEIIGLKDRMLIPSAPQIKAARVAAGLSQKQAAELVYASARAWQNWESESGSNRAMHPAIFELFLVKTNRINETPDKPK